MRIIYFIAAILIISSCRVNKENKSNIGGNTIIAHCGAWQQNGHPKNSIAALRDAVNFKYAGSEFDVRITADDSLIVLQDNRYHKLNIQKTPYDSLKVYLLPNGETLPTLREYLIAGMENNTSTKLVCDIRNPSNKERGLIMAEKAVALVKELKAQEMVIYTSYGFKILKKIESLDSSAHTQYMGKSVSPELLKNTGINGMAYQYKVFKKKPEWIQSAQEHGLSLNAWTVNEVEDMDFFLENNFDFITTDEPTLVEDKIKKMQN